MSRRRADSEYPMSSLEKHRRISRERSRRPDAASRRSDRRISVSRSKPCDPSRRDRSILLQTFADQAVIAIENTRLFEAVQARNARADRSRSNIRRRPADVLKVICQLDLSICSRCSIRSSTMRTRLCEASFGVFWHVRRRGLQLCRDIWPARIAASACARMPTSRRTRVAHRASDP